MLPSPAKLQIRSEPFDGPVARRLTSAWIAEIFASYGVASSEEPPRPHEFELPHGVFLVAWGGEEPLGCGGVKRLADGVVELKRMYVVPAARGAGVGRALLERLEQAALELGCPTVRLETGNLQHAALGLYRSAGYVEIPCWGAFSSDPKSLCLEKRLEAGTEP